MEEQSALQSRYESVVAGAKRRCAEKELAEFEDVVRKDSHAVINVPLYFAREFLAGKALYQSYQPLANAQIRRSALFEDDSRRRAVDGHLFGGVSLRLICGALSLNGCGLTSYGPVALKLANVTATAAASVLERNAYHFYEEHHIKVVDCRPLGFLSSWEDRHKLAVAKLGSRISKGNKTTEFANLLLRIGDTRQNDETMEVHVYGPLYPEAIDGVMIQGIAKLSKEERVFLKIIQENVTSRGISWNEV